MKEEKRYWYSCSVVSVYDGDTMRIDIDLGFNTWLRNIPIRLARINAPEIRGSERELGIEARDFLRNLVESASDVLVHTKEKGKYGRWIAEVIVDGANVSDMMILKGQAEAY